jgi:xanthine dehydrogenase accessory factor
MSFYDDLAQLHASGQPFVLATVVSTGGSTPQKPGSKMLVLPDGSLRGTVGGGAIELQILEAAKALLGSTEQTRVLETHLTHDLGMCCGGKMTVFLEKHSAVSRLTLYGAGHVSAELARAAKRVGFHVTVVDERATWASRERFGDVDVLEVADPVAHARAQTGGVDHFYCVITHDHALDQALIEALLRTPATYLGVIGSKRKAERFRMRLAAAGFSPAELERLKSPMGVAIRAVTAAEIAVSIVAELIALRRISETTCCKP